MSESYKMRFAPNNILVKTAKHFIDLLLLHEENLVKRKEKKEEKIRRLNKEWRQKEMCRIRNKLRE